MTNQFLNNMQKVIVKNAPTILAGISSFATATAVILAIKGTKKADRDIQQADEEAKQHNYEKAQKPERIMIYAKSYAPCIAATALAIFCDFKSDSLHKKQLAAVVGAYLISEKNYKEYRESAEELLGSKKAQEIKDKLIHKRIEENPPSDENIRKAYLPDHLHLTLWYDYTGNQYFYSNADLIRQAEAKANQQLQQTGYVGVNDIYSWLGVDEMPLATDKGWVKNSDQDPIEVRLRIGSDLIGAFDTPVGTMEMMNLPTSSYYCDTLA